MTTTTRTDEHRVFCKIRYVINLPENSRSFYAPHIVRGRVAVVALRTTKELSKESVYQHSLVVEKGTSSNSGRKMETNCFIAYIAGSGSVLHSSAGKGTDHFPSCVKVVPSGAGWKFVNLDRSGSIMIVCNFRGFFTYLYASKSYFNVAFRGAR
jgi:hypothetical protein